MSNTTDTAEVNHPNAEITEFYLLKTADKLSAPYPINCMDAVHFIDDLKAAGWTQEKVSERTSIYTAPSESNILLFMARIGVAS